jgi:N-acyl-D-aspartate/D-glutamate deacylase
MAAEIAIRGGIVVDGSGAPGRRADVAIAGGRIAGIGERLSGERELDASGQIVAPGFIDIHTHYDAQVFWDPALTPSCFHGVTTVIAGNCGFSIAPTRPEHHETIARTLENVEDMDVATLAAGIPWDFESFPEYLDSVRRRGTILNFGAYVGHTALRLYAMGDAAYERAASAEEVERMAALVGEAMRAGAAGFATSFAPTHRGLNGLPVPSRFAEHGEFEALCRAVGESGKGVIHVAPGSPVSIPDLYEIQPRVGRPFTWAALLTFPGGGHQALLELHRKGRARGARVFPQVSPRPLTFQLTMEEPFLLNVGTLFAELMARPREARLAAYRDPEWRRRAFLDLEQQAMRPRWETFQVGESEKHRELEGRGVRALAAERGIGPLDLMCELALEEDLATRFRCILANDDPEGIDFLLRQEGCLLGLSDAGAHVGQLCDAPQATDLLGNWVRGRGTLPLETAIRRLSGEPADIFGLAGRGYLRDGYCADVVVLDPARVAPGPTRRVRDFPAGAARLTADAPTGVTHVLVNGTPIQRDGRSLVRELEARPGQIPEFAAGPRS